MITRLPYSEEAHSPPLVPLLKRFISKESRNRKAPGPTLARRIPCIDHSSPRAPSCLQRRRAKIPWFAYHGVFQGFHHVLLDAPWPGNRCRTCHDSRVRLRLSRSRSRRLIERGSSETTTSFTIRTSTVLNRAHPHTFSSLRGRFNVGGCGPEHSHQVKARCLLSPLAPLYRLPRFLERIHLDRRRSLAHL